MFKFFKQLVTGHHSGGRSQSNTEINIHTDQNSNLSQRLSGNEYAVASCQSIGMERTHNEDTLFVINSFINGYETPVSFGIYLIADGMGGHQSGEVASSLAARTVGQYIIEQVFQEIIFNKLAIPHDELRHVLFNALEKAQRLILQRVPGGGTTLTAALIISDQVFTIHVGDSRLYVMDAHGVLNLRTKDHSLVKRLVDLGEITADEALTHPQRNVLYRALGQEDPLEADFSQFTIHPGERILICSDGLTGVVQENQIKKIMQANNRLENLADELVEEANHAGGPDNISVIVIQRLEK